MSTQQKRCELLTFGYINTTYNNAIPFQLMKLMQLFYDDWSYWILKDKKLQQFQNAKANEKITCSKLFKIKGIEFEIFSYPNGFTDKRGYELDGLIIIGMKIKYIPTNIKSFSFYREIKCEAVNFTRKKLYEVILCNKNPKCLALICELSELNNMKTVCFDYMINIKYIKYKKDSNKIDYYCPINKMQNKSQFTWNINN
eukprot:29487_1